MMTDPKINTHVATLTRFGDAPYFVLCDHASNAVPESYKCLGMPEDMLETHIAWDIGARDVATCVAKNLGATYLQSEFSRLLIDPNRDTASPDIIPSKSDQIPIPGNQNIDEAEREKRIAEFHVPYHKQLDQAISDLTERHATPFVISIHSFTHRLMGASQDRPWRLGFLWREDEASARVMMEHLKKTTGWQIGDNEPYDARVFNYSVDRHIGPRKLSHVTIEVRQDIIGDMRGVEEVAAHITSAVIALS